MLVFITFPLILLSFIVLFIRNPNQDTNALFSSCFNSYTTNYIYSKE